MIENPRTGAELVWRVPGTGTLPIVDGTQLAVPAGQVAVLVRDATPLASFCPGEHVLSATDMPGMIPGAEGFEAEIYYVNTASPVTLKWGMHIPYREPGTAPREPGQVRTYGTIDIHVADPWQFILYHVERQGVPAGTGAVDHQQVQGRIRDAITQAMSALLRELTLPTGDHAARCQEVADGMRHALAAPLAAMGATCSSLTVLGLERPSPIDPGHPLPGHGFLIFGGTSAPAPASGGLAHALAATTAMHATADVLTLPEAAAYLRLPEPEVLALIEAGQLQVRKIGSQYRILRHKLDGWLAQHE